MGGEIYARDFDQSLWFRNISDYPHPMRESSLEYHTSWDWLIPVIEKIESLGYRFTISARTCEIMKDNEVLFMLHGKDKIKAAYKTVRYFVDFRIK